MKTQFSPQQTAAVLARFNGRPRNAIFQDLEGQEPMNLHDKLLDDNITSAHLVQILLDRIHLAEFRVNDFQITKTNSTEAYHVLVTPYMNAEVRGIMEIPAHDLHEAFPAIDDLLTDGKVDMATVIAEFPPALDWLVQHIYQHFKAALHKSVIFNHPA